MASFFCPVYVDDPVLRADIIKTKHDNPAARPTQKYVSSFVLIENEPETSIMDCILEDLVWKPLSEMWRANASQDKLVGMWECVQCGGVQVLHQRTTITTHSCPFFPHRNGQQVQCFCDWHSGRHTGP